MNQGASQFLQVNNGGLSFVNPATTQGVAYQKVRKSVVQTGGVMLGMSDKAYSMG